MYTVKEAANITEISEHTLRFWCKCGFFPFVKRNPNNVRLFSKNDLDWIKIVKCLRSTGIENKSVKRYIDLCIAGDTTINERYRIIKDAKQKALKEMDELKNQLETLKVKEKHYQNLIKNNAKDNWNPMNDIRPDKNAVQPVTDI